MRREGLGDMLRRWFLPRHGRRGTDEVALIEQEQDELLARLEALLIEADVEGRRWGEN